MTDAANYIKWILRGFNEGGMTAYMMHLFYEQADDDGYSSLVAWTPVGEIILPKRYYTFKHFSNLVKKITVSLKIILKHYKITFTLGRLLLRTSQSLSFKFLIKVIIQSFLLIFQKKLHR